MIPLPAHFLVWAKVDTYLRRYDRAMRFLLPQDCCAISKQVSKISFLKYISLSPWQRQTLGLAKTCEELSFLRDTFFREGKEQESMKLEQTWNSTR